MAIEREGEDGRGRARREGRRREGKGGREKWRKEDFRLRLRCAKKKIKSLRSLWSQRSGLEMYEVFCTLPHSLIKWQCSSLAIKIISAVDFPSCE